MDAFHDKVRPKDKATYKNMRNYRLIITGLLLSLVTLTAVAQENLSPQGCRRGTPRPQSVHFRSGGSEGRTPGGDFYHGERHQLTVLVAFNDRPFVGDEAATLEQWNKIFNTENLTEEPFKGSVHDYFIDQSYGEFNVIFDLVYVQVSGDAEKYASTYSHDEKSQYLVQDVMDILKRDSQIDWGKYDWNGDGYVNQLLIIFAGHGMNDSSEPNLIWPHQWWMSNRLKDMQQGVYCDPIPVSYDGNDYLVDCYCALAELKKDDSYGTFGTICHEYTHCFGFPDFYYYSGKPLQGWDLMDSGNYNGDGFQPASYSAHERWLMGWLTPIELKETTSIVDMPALADEGKAYLIRNDGHENEYYIVENRQPLDWDASLPGSGIVVFHIDYDPSIWTNTNTYTNSADIKRYSMFYANDQMNPYTEWPYPYQENNSLTNTSTPAATLNHDNSDGTKFMSKPITDMTVTDGLASFNITVPTTTGMTVVTTGASQLLYRFGMVDIVRDTKGNIRKIIRK
jgi:M6 family metalloprotease-like protein